MKTRQRPNAQYVKYYQWVLAGKIALAIHAVPDIEASLAEEYDARKKNNIYVASATGGVITPHYSIIGQEWLRRLGITIAQLS